MLTFAAALAALLAQEQRHIPTEAEYKAMLQEYDRQTDAALKAYHDKQDAAVAASIAEEKAKREREEREAKIYGPKASDPKLRAVLLSAGICIARNREAEARASIKERLRLARFSHVLDVAAQDGDQAIMVDQREKRVAWAQELRDMKRKPMACRDVDWLIDCFYWEPPMSDEKPVSDDECADPKTREWLKVRDYAGIWP